MYQFFILVVNKPAKADPMACLIFNQFLRHHHLSLQVKRLRDSSDHLRTAPRFPRAGQPSRDHPQKPVLPATSAKLYVEVADPYAQYQGQAVPAARHIQPVDAP